MGFFRRLFRNKVNNKVPKESLRSLIIEGVVKIKLGRRAWDDCDIDIVSKVPIKHWINKDGYCVISYIDGSSPVVINEEDCGLVFV